MKLKKTKSQKQDQKKQEIQFMQEELKRNGLYNLTNDYEKLKQKFNQLNSNKKWGEGVVKNKKKSGFINRRTQKNTKIVKKKIDPPKRKILPQAVYLESKRGTKINEIKHCNNCGQLSKPVWRYSKSNFDEVFLCESCKYEVWDRSFGRIDAMDHADSGGAFEMNRRRH